MFSRFRLTTMWLLRNCVFLLIVTFIVEGEMEGAEIQQGNQPDYDYFNAQSTPARVPSGESQPVDPSKANQPDYDYFNAQSTPARVPSGENQPVNPSTDNQPDYDYFNAQSTPNRVPSGENQEVDPATDNQGPQFRSAVPSDDQTPDFRSVPVAPTQSIPFKSIEDPIQEFLYQHDPTEQQISYRSGPSAAQPPIPLSPDYCTLGSQHTMCIYKRHGCEKRNARVVTDKMSEDDIHMALGIHNYLRHQVSLGQVKGLPPANPEIPSLEWDPELAEMAQRWADQCSLGRDTNRRTERYVIVGQNMYFLGSANLTGEANLWKRAVERWFDEVGDFLKYKGVVTSFDQSLTNKERFWEIIGAFSQVIWAKTKYVGCGKFLINDPSDDLPYQIYMVCDYAPGGNIEGFPIYTVA